MSIVIKTLIVLIVVVLLIIVSAATFIGAGYLISLILPLTLFQSSILSIGATFVLAFILSAVMMSEFMPYRGKRFEYYNDDEDDEDEDDEFRKRLTRKLTVVKSDKTGRNEPCPCGSGKKYKHCCGK